MDLGKKRGVFGRQVGQRLTFDRTFLLSLFETGGDPNGQCAFLDLTTFKIQKGDCNKDQTYFFCASGKRKHFLFLMKLTPFLHFKL